MKITVEQLAVLAIQILKKKSFGFEKLVSAMRGGLRNASKNGMAPYKLPTKRELYSAAFIALNALGQWDKHLGVFDRDGFNVCISLNCKTSLLSKEDLDTLKIQNADPRSPMLARCQLCGNETLLVYAACNVESANASCDACIQKLIDASQYGFIEARFGYYPASAGGDDWGAKPGDFTTLREFIEACMAERPAAPYPAWITRRGEVIDQLLRVLGPLPRNAVQQHAVERLKAQLPSWREDHPSWMARVAVKQVNWELLASTGDPWESIVAHYKRFYEERHESVDEQRFSNIRRFSPTEVFLGKGSFDGYLAFIFEEHKIAVLDSMKVGNATYAMVAEEWRDLSRFSKTELLKEHPNQIARVIHNSQWLETLERLFGVHQS